MGGEPMREVSGIDARALPDDILRSPEPLVLRGLVAHWPLVRAGRESAQAACDYLKKFYRGSAVTVMAGPPEIKGRFFYNADFTGFNFSLAKAQLAEVLDELLRVAGRADAGAIYVGSTFIDACLPGLRGENDVALGGRVANANIWIGNRTRVAAHHDGLDNLACVVVGRRRFTLFPPQEVANLYVGPFELTPAGQPISLVDFANPDFERFPKFRQALAHARIAELGAGDALVIPSLWWHYVEGLEDLNVLINYWWDTAPAFVDAPLLALLFAMMTIRDLPPEKRAAWEAQFRHYVFEADETTAAHIPRERRRLLGMLDADIVRKTRAYILARLKR
jgi:hypothetical protein